MSKRFRAATLLAGLAALPAASTRAQAPSGVEFQVNSYTTNHQYLPTPALDAAGRFVVVWTSFGEDGNGAGIFGQRHDVSGARLGAELQISSFTSGHQRQPALASDPSGRFVVVWHSQGQDGSDYGVFGRRYEASGLPLGGEFRVNSYTTGAQYGPAIAATAAGDVIVAWHGGRDGSAAGISGQRYSSSGQARGVEFQVNSYTTGEQGYPAVASDPAGNFVVAWTSQGQDGSGSGVFAQRHDAAGVRRGAEFRVNSWTTGDQYGVAVASDAVGNLVLAWQSQGQDGGLSGIFGQRFDAAGLPRGAEFRVNEYTTGSQWAVSLAADAAGDFIAAWTSTGQDGSGTGAFARRFDAAGSARGGEFRINGYTTAAQSAPAVASDLVGNFVVTWASYGQDGSAYGIFGRRYGGVVPAALAVDPSAGGGSDGNGVVDPGETAIVQPSWLNRSGAALSLGGTALSFSGPSAAGTSYSIEDGTASYGTLANGGSSPCGDCYGLSVQVGVTRPASHWDTSFLERLTPDAQGQTKAWTLHVGESFDDVVPSSPYYRFIETLLHKGVTGGCAAASYCPATEVTREQLAVFVLAGKEGAGYAPEACTRPVFADVPAASPFCPFIEELARRGVVSGCGGGNYCPTAAVTREQMPVFVLRVLEPTLDPPPCATPALFADVPASSPFCRFIEELARRGVVGGCGGGNYCPAGPVPREQMAVFIVATFGLTLYGP